MTSDHVLERLSELFVYRGVPRYLRSDNGPEFTATRVHRDQGSTVAGAIGGKDTLHRAGESLGERIDRVFQWQAS